MPAAFIGHGSPMNALADNEYTRTWRQFGDSVPRPRAILIVSAHWYVNATVLTTMERPATIHDFYGFPQALFDVQYPAPGLPDLVGEVAEIVKPTWVGADVDSWGLDHGTWSVLVHAFPKADIPVVQLSIDATKPLQYHLDLGAKLAKLRERGVLIMGSGNVVHNLGGMDMRLGETGFDWARQFDDDAREFMLGEPAEVARLAMRPDYRLAAPTPDHFIPLLYVAGLADAANETTKVLTEGYLAGSLSMTAYTLGMPAAA